jgi:hypothetical protein
MLTYSVWNTDTRQYDYYRGPGPGGTHAGSPKVRARNALGASPEQAAWPLPSSAMLVGSGPMPKGRIASKRSTAPIEALAGLAGIDLDPLSIGIVAVLAYIAWRVFK